MKWTYDMDVPVLYLRLAEGPSVRQRELEDGCIVDFSESGEVIGVEILAPAEAVVDLDALQRVGVPDNALRALHLLVTGPFPIIRRVDARNPDPSDSQTGQEESIELALA